MLTTILCLIAAAPDLLEALRLAALLLNNQGMRNTPEKKRINDAIAKATGAQ